MGTERRGCGVCASRSARASSPNPAPLARILALAGNRAPPLRVSRAEALLPTASPSSNPDGVLVARAAGGDHDAFGELVRRYGAQVLAVIEKQVSDHHAAHDLAQDVWLRVHRALGGFHVGADFRPWLFAIAFNRVRDDRRARGSERATTLAAAGSIEEVAGRAAPARYEPTGQIDEAQAIDAALALVPEPFRSALHLVDVLGLDHSEAAAALDCAAGTIKSRVHRGRLHFREHYDRLSAAPDRAPRASSSTRTPR